MSNGKVMTIHLIPGLIKQIWRDFIDFNSIVEEMRKYYPKPYK